MPRHISENFFCALPLLVIVFSVSCAPTGRGYDDTIVEQAVSQNLNSSENQPDRWWRGPAGKSAMVDIGFDAEGLQIQVIRTYLRRNKINSPVGLGWTHNYLMHFRKVPHSRLKLFNADGSESIFSSSGPGIFTSPSEEGRRLTQDQEGTLRLQEPGGTVFHFNPKGRLTSILEEKGNKITVAYGADGYLQSLSDLAGNGMTFHYDSETHQLQSIVDKKGRFVSYEHDRVGNLMSVTNAKGLTTKHWYDRLNNLILVTQSLRQPSEATKD